MKTNELTLKKAIELLDKSEISLSDVYKDTESVIAEKNKELNVYLDLDKDALLKSRGQERKPLRGLPIAVKNNFLTVGLPTNASSKLLDGFMSPFESTVTKKIKESGGVVIGKTNMDAWAHGSSTETSDYGSTKNPRNTSYLPGGSSGGSAAAIASDMAIAAIGSETAGSIRQPAAWCGVVGLKPTYGRTSRYGVVAMGSSLDSPGPLTKTVEDSALILNYIAGKDENDATTSPLPIMDYTKNIKKGVKGMKIGICYIDHQKIKGTPVAKAVIAAGKFFESEGAKVDLIETTPGLKKGKVLSHEHAIGVYTVVQRSEVSSNLSRYDGIRYGKDRSNFGHEAKNRVMLGTFSLSKGYADKYYVLAQKIRSLYLSNFKDLFSQYDLLISAPSPSFALPVGSLGDDPMFGELQDLLVEPSSLAGICGISIPCFRDEKTNLYLGLNIMGNYFNEEKILQAAYNFEQGTKWNPWAKI
ncbi:MAG: Glutamyl-tRNA(Gln) amidotransferase subunit A [Candidatus Roizmanbacteria bacterium GW2011_GWA2_35_8]|uniref:Glutamyl-tRNA(Gln) amidotransferase subunit A n=1 Tax=Candidatus Roizmanbacteria bacterium GW2011_GWA2_35_8 TaxID=1618479 RepID=A0A0G0G439_9BACT|nr:MAG: Glutamyl-tRNA(Gln) amidotransferase subunit A [Candidatus Roizmanbacteria bacterium GW2011_GWA2_35_8]